MFSRINCYVFGTFPTKVLLAIIAADVIYIFLSLDRWQTTGAIDCIKIFHFFAVKKSRIAIRTIMPPTLTLETHLTRTILTNTALSHKMAILSFNHSVAIDIWTPHPIFTYNRLPKFHHNLHTTKRLNCFCFKNEFRLARLVVKWIFIRKSYCSNVPASNMGSHILNYTHFANKISTTDKLNCLFYILHSLIALTDTAKNVMRNLLRRVCFVSYLLVKVVFKFVLWANKFL